MRRPSPHIPLARGAFRRTWRRLPMRPGVALALAWQTAAALAGATEPSPAIGYTEPYKLIHFVASESGVLAELAVKEGDHVAKGGVLGKLDSRVQQADRAIAREELTRLTTRYKRLERLARTHDAAPEDVEQAQSEMTIQQLRLQRIDIEFDKLTLQSPIEGVVEQIRIEVAESVTAASTPLLTIAQVDKLYLNLPLPAPAARRFHVGQEVPLVFFDPPRTVTGTVEFISQLVDPATETVRVKFVIENAGGELQSGVRCGLAGVPREPAADKPVARATSP